MQNEAAPSDQESPSRPTDPLSPLLLELDGPAYTHNLPSSILQPLLTGYWATTEISSSPPGWNSDIPEKITCYLSAQQATQLAESPLSHLFPDLRQHPISLSELSVDELPPLIYDDTTAFTPILLNDTESYFVELDPPKGVPTDPASSISPQLSERLPAKTVYNAFDTVLEDADPERLVDALLACSRLPPSSTVDIGYILVIAASASRVGIRQIGKWAESVELFSVETAYRRKRKLEEYGIITTTKQTTHQRGNFLDVLKLESSLPEPETRLQADLVAVAEHVQAECLPPESH
jgi:hypothetical protein